jgi:hypothetical protein
MSNQLQHKLLHYEAPPPERVWNTIATFLDENLSLTISEKLYQYEEEPSALVWQNISLHLDHSVSEQGKVVPFYVRYRRPLKYSGTAAILIFLAVMTSLFISKKTESEVPPQGVANSVEIRKDTSKPSEVSTENNSVAKLSGKNGSEHLIAKSKVLKTRQEEYQSSNLSFEDFLPQQAEKNEVVRSSIPSDKYMMYSDGDGNVVRLPKKIFNAFACPTEDVKCKQKLQQLKEKFAQSAMTADFTGLLQILKSLQENQ